MSRSSAVENPETRCHVMKATSCSAWSSCRHQPGSAGSKSRLSASGEVGDGQFQRGRQPDVSVHQRQPVPVDLDVPVRVEGEFPGQQAQQRLQVCLADAERAQQ